jgi:hypothetical protein
MMAKLARCPKRQIQQAFLLCQPVIGTAAILAASKGNPISGVLRTALNMTGPSMLWMLNTGRLQYLFIGGKKLTPILSAASLTIDEVIS